VDVPIYFNILARRSERCIGCVDLLKAYRSFGAFTYQNIK